MKLISFLTIFKVIIEIQSNKVEKLPSIVDGSPTEIDKVPFQVSLERKFRHNCGGSLISNYHIVTAAHCIDHIQRTDRVQESELRVRAGTSKTGVGGVIILVQLVVIAPNYNSYMVQNDIGIVKLKNPAQFTSTVKPIALDPNWPQAVDACIVSGYGSQQGSQKFYPEGTLKMANLEVYSKDECRHRFGLQVGADKVCAGYRQGYQGVCFGDSGGPLTINGRLAGVVSTGKGCGQYGPGAYTSTRYFYDWINECVRKTSNGATNC